MSKCCGIPFTKHLLHPKYWGVWLGLALTVIISLLPRFVRHAIGRQIGVYIYKKNKKRHHIVMTNLKIVFPSKTDEERSQIALEHLQWYGCAIVDYSLFFFASKNRLANLSELRGKEHIDAIKSEGNNSIILLLAHSVMLEFAPPQVGFHYDAFGSYKTSKNPVIDWMVARSRCRHVAKLVSREEGLRKLVKSISPEKIMIFLPDEDLGSENAVFAPFFGKTKATLSTTARLAKMGKAKALPMFSYFDPVSKKYITEIGPALENYPSKDAVADAITMNQAIEVLIAKYPAQYMWFMKWYFTRPEGDPPAY